MNKTLNSTCNLNVINLSPTKPLWLYVGCGNHRIEGFVHVDINVAKRFKKGRPVRPHDVIADISQHIPVGTGSVDLIFSRATLEHLSWQQLINHFLECYRLLRHGGVVRMCVPDLDIMIR